MGVFTPTNGLGLKSPRIRLTKLFVNRNLYDLSDDKINLTTYALFEFLCNNRNANCQNTSFANEL